ncbi:hypothetical protein AK812_SmicGene20572 [Symbiodinium microadriaticum]|uniref:Uncharacterized protein n=1 Tax=Symbiodinium microadriaticum TaxID=2951 RepID=A0A1Q9DPL4_SYMMI|nr:hypothetical protein AK812_SmicGene20572 [Symbiodinium microadriaticum]
MAAWMSRDFASREKPEKGCMSVMLLELSPVRASDDMTNSILYGCPDYTKLVEKQVVLERLVVPDGPDLSCRHWPPVPDVKRLHRGGSEVVLEGLVVPAGPDLSCRHWPPVPDVKRIIPKFEEKQACVSPPPHFQIPAGHVCVLLPRQQVTDAFVQLTLGGWKKELCPYGSATLLMGSERPNAERRLATYLRQYTEDYTKLVEEQGAFADVIAYPCLRLLSCHFNLKTQMVGSLPTPLAVEDLFSGFQSSGRLSAEEERERWFELQQHDGGQMKLLSPGAPLPNDRRHSNYAAGSDKMAGVRDFFDAGDGHIETHASKRVASVIGCWGRLAACETLSPRYPQSAVAPAAAFRQRHLPTLTVLSTSLRIHAQLVVGSQFGEAMPQWVSMAVVVLSKLPGVADEACGRPGMFARDDVAAKQHSPDGSDTHLIESIFVSVREAPRRRQKFAHSSSILLWPPALAVKRRSCHSLEGPFGTALMQQQDLICPGIASHRKLEGCGQALVGGLGYPRIAAPNEAPQFEAVGIQTWTAAFWKRGESVWFELQQQDGGQMKLPFAGAPLPDDRRHSNYAAGSGVQVGSTLHLLVPATVPSVSLLCPSDVRLKDPTDEATNTLFWRFWCEAWGYWQAEGYQLRMYRTGMGFEDAATTTHCQGWGVIGLVIVSASSIGARIPFEVIKRLEFATSLMLEMVASVIACWGRLAAFETLRCRGSPMCRSKIGLPLA